MCTGCIIPVVPGSSTSASGHSCVPTVLRERTWKLEDKMCETDIDTAYEGRSAVPLFLSAVVNGHKSQRSTALETRPLAAGAKGYM